MRRRYVRDGRNLSDGGGSDRGVCDSCGGPDAIRVRPGGPSIESSRVDCLAVNGRTATIAGTLPPNPDGYTDFAVTVVDAGPTASTPDLMGFVITSGVPRGCSGPTGVLGTLVTGDIVATDARPFPTAKA